MPKRQRKPQKERRQKSRTQKERTEETRQRLLEAAREIFIRRGFEATRIDEVARKAGYTRGAFYFNFRSKDELFIAVLQQEISRAHHQIQKLGEQYASPSERLPALRDLYTHLGSDLSLLILVVEFKLYAIRHPRSHAKMAEAFARLRTSRGDLLGQTLRSLNIVPPLRPEMLEMGFWALCSGLALERLFSNAVSPPGVRSILVAFFERVLGVENAGCNGKERAGERLPRSAASSSAQLPAGAR